MDASTVPLNVEMENEFEPPFGDALYAAVYFEELCESFFAFQAAYDRMNNLQESAPTIAHLHAFDEHLAFWSKLYEECPELSENEVVCKYCARDHITDVVALECFGSSVVLANNKFDTGAYVKEFRANEAAKEVVPPQDLEEYKNINRHVFKYLVRVVRQRGYKAAYIPGITKSMANCILKHYPELIVYCDADDGIFDVKFPPLEVGGKTKRLDLRRMTSECDPEWTHYNFRLIDLIGPDNKCEFVTGIGFSRERVTSNIDKWPQTVSPYVITDLNDDRTRITYYYDGHEYKDELMYDEDLLLKQGAEVKPLTRCIYDVDSIIAKRICDLVVLVTFDAVTNVSQAEYTPLPDYIKDNNRYISVHDFVGTRFGEPDVDLNKYRFVEITNRHLAVIDCIKMPVSAAVYERVVELHLRGRIYRLDPKFFFDGMALVSVAVNHNATGIYIDFICWLYRKGTTVREASVKARSFDSKPPRGVPFGSVTFVDPPNDASGEHSYICINPNGDFDSSRDPLIVMISTKILYPVEMNNNFIKQTNDGNYPPVGDPVLYCPKTLGVYKAYVRYSDSKQKWCFDHFITYEDVVDYTETITSHAVINKSYNYSDYRTLIGYLINLRKLGRRTDIHSIVGCYQLDTATVQRLICHALSDGAIYRIAIEHEEQFYPTFTSTTELRGIYNYSHGVSRVKLTDRDRRRLSPALVYALAKIDVEVVSFSVVTPHLVSFGHRMEDADGYYHEVHYKLSYTNAYFIFTPPDGSNLPPYRLSLTNKDMERINDLIQEPAHFRHLKNFKRHFRPPDFDDDIGVAVRNADSDSEHEDYDYDYDSEDNNINGVSG